MPGALPAVGPLAEPGQIAPVPALIAIETLAAYLRSVDPRKESSRTWADFVADNDIRDAALLGRCATALHRGRAAASQRERIPQPLAVRHEPPNSPRSAWQMRLGFDS